MTGLANHQRFPSSLVHAVRPAWHMSLFVGVQIGHLPDVVHLTCSQQVTEFASVSAESLRDLFAFRLVEGGSRIHENGLFVPFERKTTKASNQRLFSFSPFYCHLQAPPLAIRSRDSRLIAVEQDTDAGLVFGRQGM